MNKNIRNVFDLKTRKNLVPKKPKRARFKTVLKLVGAVETLNMNDYFGLRDQNELFCVHAANDYHDLKKGDLLYVNMRAKASLESFVVYLIKGKPNIEKYSEISYSNAVIIGVITHITRSLEI